LFFQQRQPEGSQHPARGAKTTRELPTEPPFNPKTPNSRNPHGYWANWANWRELNRQFAHWQFPSKPSQINGLQAKTAANAKNQLPNASRKAGKIRQGTRKTTQFSRYQTGKNIKNQ
jgi:hypothetical protein